MMLLKIVAFLMLSRPKLCRSNSIVVISTSQTRYHQSKKRLSYQLMTQALHLSWCE